MSPAGKRRSGETTESGDRFGSLAIQTAVDFDEIYRSLADLLTDPACGDLLQFRSLVTAHQYDRLLRILLDYVVPGSRVLDWGCGNGHFSFALEALDYEASGFAFGDFGVRRYLSEAYHFTHGAEDEPTSLPYPDLRFDAVTSVGVLEHVRETRGDETASMREICRILKPGGHFICYHLPNRLSWIEAISRRLPGSHFHPFLYSRADIARLCDDAGLECVHIQRYGVLPRNLWHRAPQAFRYSRAVAKTWDGLDAILGSALNPFCQNYAFVARKPRHQRDA